MDTEFLKSTVGPALAQGCAAVAAARPVDPIEYLADWLQAQANIVQLKKDILNEENLKLQKRYIAERKADEDLNKAEKLALARDTACSKIGAVREDTDYIWKFHWQELVSAICQHTSIEAAYVAVLVDESEKVDLEAIEEPSLSEFVDTPPVNPEEVAAEPKGEEEEADNDTEATDQVCSEVEQEENNVQKTTEDEPETEKPSPPVLGPEEILKNKRESFKFDHYAKKTLKYVAASEKNQWVAGKMMNMSRGVSLLEVAISKSSLYVSNASKYRMCIRAPKSEESSNEETPDLYRRIHLFQSDPKMGAYFMAPIFDSSGEVVAIMACDTLKSIACGTGLPITVDERKFLTDLAEVATSAQSSISETLVAEIASVNEYQMKKKAYDEYISWREASKEAAEKDESKDSSREEYKSFKSSLTFFQAVSIKFQESWRNIYSEIRCMTTISPNLLRVYWAFASMMQAEIIQNDWMDVRRELLKFLVEKISSFDPCSNAVSDEVWKYVKFCISDLNDVSVQTTSVYGVLLLRFCYEAAAAAGFSRAWNEIVKTEEKTEAEGADKEAPEEGEGAEE